MDTQLLAENATTPYLINPSFSGHQTFPFRYTWLKKGVDAVLNKGDVFSSDDASVILGVGKNMVSSIRHWCIVAGLIKKHDDHPGQFVATRLGKKIFLDEGFDPYLEDPATLWLIHWNIAIQKEQATAWYWAFNIYRENQFIQEKFITDLFDWTQQELAQGNGKPRKKNISENTLHRDVNCFIRTYCQSRHKELVLEESFDCPLAKLNLIKELSDNGAYEFQRGEKRTLPLEIVAATLVALWDARFSDRDTLSFSEILYSPFSPGRIFRLNEDTLTLYLEKLDHFTNGILRYDETANIKQIYRTKEPINQMELLRRYYE